MNKEPISLTHKAIIDESLRRVDTSLSEYTFANLYLFRKVHEYMIAERGNKTLIFGKTYDGVSFCMPLFPLIEENESSIRSLLKEAPMLYPIPEEQAERLGNMQLHMSWNDADSDYIYDIKTLNAYPGRHLAGRRNLVTQFLSHYQVEKTPLAESSTAPAQELLERWMTHSGTQGDANACLEAIRLFKELSLQGTLYFVEGKPVGLMIGEPLQKNTFLLHFAKADTAYKGIYQYMHQDFARSLADRYEFMNWEQDLGYLGLKQSKHAYRPLIIKKKMRITEL